MDVPSTVAATAALDAAALAIEQGGAKFAQASEAILGGAIEAGVVAMKEAEVSMSAAAAVTRSADLQLESLVDLLLG